MLWLIKLVFYGLTWRKHFRIMLLCFKRLVCCLWCGLKESTLWLCNWQLWLSTRCCAGREDKLSSDNRSVVNNFRTELSQQIVSLCNMVATSISRQNEHLQCVQDLGNSFLDRHRKVWRVFGYSFPVLFFLLILLSELLLHCCYSTLDFDIKLIFFFVFLNNLTIHACHLVSVNWGIEEKTVIFEGCVYFSHWGSAKCGPFAQGQLYSWLRGNFFVCFFQCRVY
jgi:hypothetical protein